MGSTVTTGRTAAVFRANSGAIIYCLYEQTCEKNCYPHMPHWGAIYSGQIAGAPQKIFNYASSCEGGMRQNRSGWITPEGYQRSWMSELHSPIRMTRDDSVSLYVTHHSTYAPLSQESLPAVAAAPGIAGMQDAADRLHGGEQATLSLLGHAELIARLLEVYQISAWRLLPDYSRPAEETGRDKSLGFTPTKQKIDPLSCPQA